LSLSAQLLAARVRLHVWNVRLAAFFLFTLTYAQRCTHESTKLTESCYFRKNDKKVSLHLKTNSFYTNGRGDGGWDGGWPGAENHGALIQRNLGMKHICQVKLAGHSDILVDILGFYKIVVKPRECVTLTTGGDNKGTLREFTSQFTPQKHCALYMQATVIAGQ